jgi:hypothetical protein
MEGLSSVPKSGASANSATFARLHSAVTPHFVIADFLKYLAIRFSDFHAAGHLSTRGMHLPVG